MDIKVLKSSISTGNIPNFLIFVEEEPSLSKQYIQFISDTAGKAYKYYDSADSVIYEIQTNLKDDYVYVIYNDDKVLKNLAYIDSLIKLNRSIIVCLPSLDRNSNLYKTYENYVVWFEKLDKYTLLAYANKLCKNHKITIDQNKLQTLIEYCDCNLGEIINELDKIFVLEQSNSNLLVDYMMENGFSDFRQTNVFKYVNKILNKDVSALNDLIKLDENVVSVIFIVYNQSRARLINTKQSYYGKVMRICFDVYSQIIDGSINSDYALKYLTYKILF